MEAADKQLYSFTYKSRGKEKTIEINRTDGQARMRGMERQMRQSRRLIVGYKAAGMTEDAGAERANYYAMRKEYIRFCKAMGMDTQFVRVYNDGLGRV
jgi:hypothetical protein